VKGRAGEEAMLRVFALVALFGALLYVYRRARRRHVGPAMVGMFYEAMTEERRNAVEMIVEEKAEERAPERVTGRGSRRRSPRG
jgi:hypothetical protein